MKTARIFTCDRSQVVRLPKEYHFDCEEVFVEKQGDQVILTAKRVGWDEFFDSVSVFGDDFLIEREEPLLLERDFP